MHALRGSFLVVPFDTLKGFFVDHAILSTSFTGGMCLPLEMLPFILDARFEANDLTVCHLYSSLCFRVTHYIDLSQCKTRHHDLHSRFLSYHDLTGLGPWRHGPCLPFGLLCKPFRCRPRRRPRTVRKLCSRHRVCTPDSLPDAIASLLITRGETAPRRALCEFTGERDLLLSTCDELTVVVCPRVSDSEERAEAAPLVLGEDPPPSIATDAAFVADPLLTEFSPNRAVPALPSVDISPSEVM